MNVGDLVWINLEPYGGAAHERSGQITHIYSLPDKEAVEIYDFKLSCYWTVDPQYVEKIDTD